MISIPVKKLQNGFVMPVFGLGTWMMGGAKEHDLNNDDQVNIAAIKRAIEAGITLIDTAENYAQGYCETLVGRAIKDYDRHKLFLVSKADKYHHSPKDLENALETSLKRLDTNYLDLYLLHAPSPDIPIEATMPVLDQLKDKGLIKEFGVSNFTVKQIKRAQQVAKSKIVVNQLHYNLAIRECEQAGLVDYCQQNDVLLMAWRPVQKGFLANHGIPILDQICQKYQKTPAQVAINWLISQPNVVTLSKMDQPSHLTENLRALGWEMEKADIELLRKEFPNQQSVSDSVPLKEWTI